MVCQFYNGMVCPPATSEAGARWPRFGLVVVATTNRRDNKVQMIRTIVVESWRQQQLSKRCFFAAIKRRRGGIGTNVCTVDGAAPIQYLLTLCYEI
jgi:hypothetical protein